MGIKRPKMILFDYGGTMLCEPDLDHLRGETAVFAHVVQNPRGCTPEELAAWEQTHFHWRVPIRDLGGELTEIQLLRLKYELHGIQLDIPWEEAEYVLWSNSSPMTEGCVYPHIREVLRAIYERGIRTGVISNLVWSGASLKKRIDTLLQENHFEFIITSSDYGIRKPDVQLFQLALAKAGLGAEDVWYCGNDHRKDIASSRSAGLFPVWYLGHMEGDRKDSPEERVRDADAAAITDWYELLELIDHGGQ